MKMIQGKKALVSDKNRQLPTKCEAHDLFYALFMEKQVVEWRME